MAANPGRSVAVLVIGSGTAYAAPPDGSSASCQGYLSSTEPVGGRAFVAFVVFKSVREESGATGRTFYASVAQAEGGSLAACTAVVEGG